MARIPTWRRYARFFGVDVRSDVDDELRFHLEEKTRDLMARGLPSDAARAEAQRQFGDTTEIRQLCQALGQSRVKTLERREYWSGWRQDVHYAARMLRKTPLVSAVAILSIALGIGANTAIFTLLDQVLLRRLPVADPDRLVRVFTQGFYYGSTNGTGRELSYQMYTDLRDRNEAFSDIFAFFPLGAAVSVGGGAEMTRAELVTGNYFGTLGIGAIRGRVIAPEDDRAPGGHPVAVISHGYWQRRFGGDPEIVGRVLTIANHPLTIVGVVEPGFDGMNLTTATQVFVPVTMEAQVMPTAVRLPDRGLRWLIAYARLKPGVTPEQAEASLVPLYRALREQDLNDTRFARASEVMKRRYMNENHIDVVVASGGHAPMRGQLGRPLWLLMAIVSGVLLIACANVANLLLARGASRQREIAVRLSLGATRGRIVRQLLVESVMLGVAGGIGGLLLAIGGVQMLIGFFMDPDSVTLIRATPDARVLAFTSVVAMLTGVLCGVVPAVQSTKPALAPTLKDHTASVLGGGQVRVRKALVVSQVALSLLLLIGAGLFLRSLSSLMSVDLGFKRDHLLTFGADPTVVGYKDVRAKQFALDVLARVRATPGVEAAAFARLGVLWGGAWGGSIAIEGYPAREDEEIGSRLNAVSPGYFAAMGIPLLMGRDFHEGDFRAHGPGVPSDDADDGYRAAIISESFVRRYMPDNPLGRHIGFGPDPGTPTRIEVVGVVKDSIYTGPDEERQWQIYLPFLESRDASSAWFYVRTAQDPEPMLQTMRGVLREIHPNVPPLMLRTMDGQLKRSLVNQRLVTGLSTAFGLLATLLSVVGLYGVIAYSVTRRTREIGVRMALGALAPRVVWLVMREAVTLIVCGIALAVPAAFWLSRYVRSELHGVSPDDPVTIGAAVLALSVVAAVASLIPARRAARINPIRALRQD